MTAPRPELRAVKRVKTFVVGELQRDDQAMRVHVLDVSTAGALVHARSAPSIGEGVHLTLGRHGDPGRIVWVDNDRFGIRFSPPLSAARLDRNTGR